MSSRSGCSTRLGIWSSSSIISSGCLFFDWGRMTVSWSKSFDRNTPLITALFAPIDLCEGYYLKKILERERRRFCLPTGVNFIPCQGKRKCKQLYQLLVYHCPMARPENTIRSRPKMIPYYASKINSQQYHLPIVLNWHQLLDYRARTCVLRYPSKSLSNTNIWRIFRYAFSWNRSDSRSRCILGAHVGSIRRWIETNIPVTSSTIHSLEKTVDGGAEAQSLRMRYQYQL